MPPLDIVMVAGLLAILMTGFHVVFALAGTAILFAGLGYLYGTFDFSYFLFFPNRIYGLMLNEVLIAVPLFVFMGMMLERSRVAEDLLETMGRLFGTRPGGLGLSVCVVGALLAASTGVVGATVVTMGLLSLPTMLRRGYRPELACGVITASGTLGQIIPPSIVLVMLGDVISNAYVEAQGTLGNHITEPVSVGDLFAGALFPGLLLVAFYVLYLVAAAWLRPHWSPAIPPDDDIVGDGKAGKLGADSIIGALLAPIILIIAVLGSILGGIATPTEAAGVGAIGAVMLGAAKISPHDRKSIYAAGACLVALLLLSGLADLRMNRDAIAPAEKALIAVAVLLCGGLAWGLAVGLVRTSQAGALTEAMRQTTKISAMLFGIIIGAQLFSLVFRGLGGDETVHDFLHQLPGGPTGAMVFFMAMLFVMGFFLDTIEITFIVVPLVAPVLFLMGFDPVWLGIMIAVNLQTSFLTPPFGFALFYLRGVAPPSVSTGSIYRGVIPFVAIQLLMLVILALAPDLATWLPSVVFD